MAGVAGRVSAGGEVSEEEARMIKYGNDLKDDLLSPEYRDRANIPSSSLPTSGKVTPSNQQAISN